MRYCRLFQYLFRLKRMQLEVDKAWLTINGARGSIQEAPGTAPRSQSLWHVHSHIAHFMTNLQTYVQVQIYCKTPTGFPQDEDLVSSEFQRTAGLFVKQALRTYNFQLATLCCSSPGC